MVMNNEHYLKYFKIALLDQILRQCYVEEEKIGGFFCGRVSTGMIGHQRGYLI